MKLDIDPTAGDRQSLYAEIQRRNFFRKKAQLPLIDVPVQYARELALIREAKFRHILRPYLNKALSELPEVYGLPNRIGRQRRAEVIAFERLICDYDCGLDDLPVSISTRQRLLGKLSLHQQ